MTNPNLLDPSPDHIYHYTTASAAIEHILHSNTLRFSRMSQGNDPIEFENYTPSASGDDPSDILTTGKSIVNAVKKGFRFASFCIDNAITTGTFGKGYQKCRMWSQYADNHRGVCLVFSKTKILEILKKNLAKDYNNDFLLFDDKIVYTNALAKLHGALNFSPQHISISKNELLEKNKKEYLFTKVTDYQEESEYRITFYNEKLEEDKITVVSGKINKTNKATEPIFIVSSNKRKEGDLEQKKYTIQPNYASFNSEKFSSHYKPL